MARTPIICIPCNRSEWQRASAHVVKHQYVRPLLEIVHAVPLLIPAVGESFSLSSIADRIDGILLTGAASHVHPLHYDAAQDFPDDHLDTARDATTLRLIKDAIQIDMPLFAICRGFQELNVACGGTLHQHVHKLDGKLDHRSDYNKPLAQQYETHKHKITVQKGGVFERLGLPQSFTVNSLHDQGVDKLGSGLFVEGISEDSLIEAVSVPQKRFIFGTQWHPEGDFWLNPVSQKLFEEFARVVNKK